MKNLFYPALLTAIITFSSCNKDEITDVQQSNQFAKEKVNEPIETSNLQSIAAILSHTSINKDICKEVYEAVRKANSNGLEESYYFQEILNNENNKIITRSNNTSLLGSLIRDYFSNPATRSTDDANSINLDLLAKSDIQIYWPYSEDWDGKTLPVITYAPEDEDQEWNYAYKKIGDKIDTIIVNEEYMEKYPVWIINKSDISYEDLPFFSLNQYIKDNVLFIPNENNNKQIDNLSNSTRAIGDPVYTLYLGKFMSEKQYDSVFRGGSDFVIQMGQAQNYSITPENLTSLNMYVSYIRVHRSRKDIKKRRWKDVNAVLVSDWLPEENDAAFMIHEDDGGGSRKWDADISVSLGGKNYGAKVSIPYGKGDELIYKIVYKRDFIFSTNNSEGTEHTASGVYFTLPYKIGRVIK